MTWEQFWIFLGELAKTPWVVPMALLLFGSIVFIHELGHFLAARWRGLKVERFSIGFGPKIVGWERDGVHYQLSWIPLGGYVALPQLADNTGLEGKYENEEENLPPVKYVDKVIVASAGAFFNILYALALGAVLWMVGFPSNKAFQDTLVGYVPEEVTIKGETMPTPAFAAGLQTGDRILEVDGNSVSTWNEFTQLVVTGTGRTESGDPKVELVWDRKGERIEKTVYPIRGDNDVRYIFFANPAGGEVRANFIWPNSPAEQMGLETGDIIAAVNGTPIFFPGQIGAMLSENEDTPVTMTVKRGPEEAPETLALTGTPELTQITKDGREAWLLGFQPGFETISVYKDPVTWVWEHLSLTGRTVYSLFHPGSDVRVKSLSGPVGIFYMLIELARDPRLLIWLVVLINVNLAVLNMLPMPVLDGGHILFATISKLRGKPLPINLVAGVQSAFVLLLFGLMFYVMFFDVQRVGDQIAATADAVTAQEQLVDPVFGEGEAKTEE